MYLTFDVDWAPDELVAEVVSSLERRGLRGTIFATHDSPLLKSLPKDEFEIALHPNFDLGDGRYDLSALLKLKNAYPTAIGMRSHSLFFSSRMLSLLEECDITYESNIFLEGHLGLHPVHRTRSITSIPFNWSDDKHVELERPFTLDTFPELDQEGLNVFCFHPVHIFLNTDVQDRYVRAKSALKKPELREHVNPSTGIATLFDDLCRELVRSRIHTGLLSELCL